MVLAAVAAVACEYKKAELSNLLEVVSGEEGRRSVAVGRLEKVDRCQVDRN